ncbi:MAG: hypothetical protein WAV11_01485 [Minisyncoccia bacterium]
MKSVLNEKVEKKSIDNELDEMMEQTMFEVAKENCLATLKKLEITECHTCNLNMNHWSGYAKLEAAALS